MSIIPRKSCKQVPFIKKGTVLSKCEVSFSSQEVLFDFENIQSLCSYLSLRPQQQHSSFSPTAGVCRWSQTLTLCSVQTGWSTSPPLPSTALCGPRRPQTQWCGEPAAVDSSPAACRCWWSGWLFCREPPSLSYSIGAQSNVVDIWSESRFQFQCIKLCNKYLFS